MGLFRLESSGFDRVQWISDGDAFLSDAEAPISGGYDQLSLRVSWRFHQRLFPPEPTVGTKYIEREKPVFISDVQCFCEGFIVHFVSILTWGLVFFFFEKRHRSAVRFHGCFSFELVFFIVRLFGSRFSFCKEWRRRPKESPISAGAAGGATFTGHSGANRGVTRSQQLPTSSMRDPADSGADQAETADANRKDDGKNWIGFPDIHFVHRSQCLWEIWPQFSVGLNSVSRGSYWFLFGYYWLLIKFSAHATKFRRFILFTRFVFVLIELYYLVLLGFTWFYWV